MEPHPCNASTALTWTLKECTNVLCLLDKTENWTPETDDEAFELDSRHTWVTGISRGPPDEFDIQCLSPVRHAFSDTMISNCNDPVSGQPENTLDT